MEAVRLFICICFAFWFLAPAHAQITQAQCPTAAILAGEAPPKGEGQWCQIRALDGKGYVNHGPFVQYYPLVPGKKPQKMVEGEFHEGKASGDWREWWPDGKAKARGLLKDDQKYGRWTTWHRNGKKASDGDYLHDKARGPVKRWDAEGRPLPDGR